MIEKAAGDLQLATGLILPAASCQLPATSHQLPVASRFSMKELRMKELRNNYKPLSFFCA